MNDKVANEPPRAFRTPQPTCNLRTSTDKPTSFPLKFPRRHISGHLVSPMTGMPLVSDSDFEIAGIGFPPVQDMKITQELDRIRKLVDPPVLSRGRLH